MVYGFIERERLEIKFLLIKIMILVMTTKKLKSIEYIGLEHLSLFELQKSLRIW